MAAADKTLRNLTTRFVQMEKEVKQSEKEKESDALLSKRVNLTTSLQPRDDKEENGRAVRKCWKCGDTSHFVLSWIKGRSGLQYSFSSKMASSAAPAEK